MTAGQAPNITILSALHKAKKGWENEKRMVSAQNVTNSRSNVGLSTLIYTEYHHIAYFLNQVSNVWVSTKPVKIECEGVPDPGILEHLNNLLLSLPLFILLLLSSCTSLLFFFFAYCFLCWSFLAFALTSAQKFIVTLHFLSNSITMDTWKNASRILMMLEWGELVKPWQGPMKCKFA